ncbi:Uma2 family endonuclease [Planktothrix mougeotii]|uniref:Uma2 family endonuclease n=1 Tax=Planktothrix mougeotii LEGE 06226 TaxID=1828728 RepID=A0ABR9UKE0_9CYAN|nr:Uma2 family endonuclease [Planktothrix mougeotii]MBE9146009.1 Uma2 family endonuclease [Planktothrix mougeotii LEGE 06226]
MILQVEAQKIYTLEDYLDFEVNSPERHEYINGEIRPMTAEVLSASTRNYDKDEKFAAYRTLPTFQEYLLIDQYTIPIEHYYKTDEKHWIFVEYNNSNETLVLNSISLEMVIADLDDKVEF